MFVVGRVGAGVIEGRPLDTVEIEEGTLTRVNIELAGAKDNVKLARDKCGRAVVVVKRLGVGTDRVLTPEEFVEVLLEQRRGSGWLEKVFNITGPGGIFWVILGLSGQLFFTGRMFVQWMASEAKGRSVIPVSFWWMSLLGSTMLLIYFVWRRDIVGVLGQAMGLFIYVRNLVLIARPKG